MTLLTNAPTLVVQTDLAMLIGQDEAMLLQQLHYRLANQGVAREGRIWFFHTYESWKKQIPFWSISKLKSKFLKLEKMGLVQSTDKFNQFYVDRTKWYSIDYDKLDALFLANAIQSNPTDVTHETKPSSPDKRCDRFNVSPSDTKEVYKNNNNNIYASEIDEVINYLNDKAKRGFTVSNESNRRDIQQRLQEGYCVEQCFSVIDTQVKAWQDDVKMSRYLRPSTLFKKANFENYLNAANQTRNHYLDSKPLELDYSAGEDIG
ncbi:conserved phage C-terminal domain-containing protein [Solibacillus sp. FSL H8-0523]|uniref:conserved phage C-terminal domain-containing protein n=1 Tax=Solibacillus sp. FSL H8-0523 TaxID=2954511 RepID=UPI0031018C1F